MPRQAHAGVRRHALTDTLVALFLSVSFVGAASLAAPPSAAAATATGSISGVVTGPNGEATGSLAVMACLDHQPRYDCTTYEGWTYAASDGTYTIAGLAPGDYLVGFVPQQTNYVSEWWDNAPDVTTAKAVHVAAGAAVTGVDATLAAGASVSGRITDASGAPLPSVTVWAFNQKTAVQTSAESGADGTYTVRGLAAGTYKVQFDPWMAAAGNFVGEWWNDKPDEASAAPINLATGQSVTGKDAVLSPGATISGLVRGPGGAVIQSGVYCAVERIGGEFVDDAQLSSDGTFTLQGLAPGQYRLGFYTGDTSYRSEYWNNAADAASATLITVTNQSATTGVNVQLARPVPYAVPSISGAAMAGGTLTAKPGAWASGATFTYQWSADGAAISGATAATYKPTAAQVGKTIRVKVMGHLAGYDSASVTSAATAKVITAPVPTISGTVGVGQTLTAKPGAWTAGTALNYQWYAGGAAVKGATASTFTVTSAQVGKQIVVMDKGHLTGYASPTMSSAATPKVLGVGAPSFGGVDMAGGVLSARPGTWTSGTTFAYQWYADGAAIAGATKSTYSLTSAQVGHAIRLRVTGSQTGYATMAALSGTSPKVIAAGTATIAGTAKVGSKLSAGHGTWTAGTTFTYQWLANCAAIAGATGSTFMPAAAQRGKALTVQVTGHLAGYATVTRTSAATAAVS